MTSLNKPTPTEKNLNKHVIQQFAYNYAVCVLKYHKNIKLLIIFPQQKGIFFYDTRKVLSLKPPACTSSVCQFFSTGINLKGV